MKSLSDLLIQETQKKWAKTLPEKWQKDISPFPFLYLPVWTRGTQAFFKSESSTYFKEKKTAINVVIPDGKFLVISSISFNVPFITDKIRFTIYDDEVIYEPYNNVSISNYATAQAILLVIQEKHKFRIDIDTTNLIVKVGIGLNIYGWFYPEEFFLSQAKGYSQSYLTGEVRQVRP